METANRKGGAVATPAAARIVSIRTPFHLVSNLDHRVTQCMSPSQLERSRRLSSSQVKLPRTSPSTLSDKVQALISIKGVGPIERTGKSVVSCCPGGTL